MAVYIKKDIASVYYGVSFGYVLHCLLQFYLIFTSDWEHIAQEAIKRVSKSKETGKKTSCCNKSDKF